MAVKERVEGPRCGATVPTGSIRSKRPLSENGTALGIGGSETVETEKRPRKLAGWPESMCAAASQS